MIDTETALLEEALGTLKAIVDSTGTTQVHPYECMVSFVLIGQADRLLATDAARQALERRERLVAVLDVFADPDNWRNGEWVHIRDGQHLAEDALAQD